MAINQLLRPRHLSATALVFLLTSTAAIIGVAVADEDAALQTPPLRIGDRLEYETDGRRSTYEVRGLESFRNGTHEMQVFVVTWTREDGKYSIDHLLEATTGQVVAQRFADNTTTFAGVAPGLGEVRETQTSLVEYMEWGPGICGFLHPWQQQGWSARAMAWQCGYSEQTTWTLLRPGQVEVKQVYPEGGLSNWQIMYDQNIPYPMVVARVYEMASGHMEAEEPFEWRLVGFEPGHADLPVVAPPRPLALPPIHHAPLTPWMIDEQGLDLDIPLWAAYRAAVDDTDAAAWLRAHPDAYLASAWFTDADGDAAYQRWSLLFSDTRQRLLLYVEREQENLLSLIATPLLVSVVAQDAEPLSRPRLADVSDLPTAQSLGRVWTALKGSPPSELGFSITCRADCTAPEAVIRIGTSTASMEPWDGENTLTEHRESAWIGFDGSGAMTGNSLVAWSSRPAQDPMVAAAVPDNLHAFEAPAFSPVQVAGALTALVALFYFLHPLGKSGGAALFSRIRRDEALDHPARRRILDAVAAQPGIRYGALRDTTELSNGACQHHVQRLLATGHIVVSSTGRQRCYFAKGSQDHRKMVAIAALERPGARKVFDAVGRSRGTSAVAAAAGLAPSTAHHHLVRLQEAGLVTKVGRTWRRHP